MEFHVRLRQLRKDHNVTQVVLACELGLTERQYQRLEAGDSKPMYENLLALAVYFNVPIDFMVGKTGADLTKANLSQADMREVKACGAVFREANLSRADLRDADLRWADFSYANLQNAILDGANVDGAIFHLANVSGTILEGRIIDGRYVP